MSEVVLASARVVAELIEIKIKRKKAHKKWTRKWLSRRNRLGVSKTLLEELASEDPQSYFNFFRIDEEMFNFLLSKVTAGIQKQNTIMRNAIPAKLKLQIALRFLSSGDSLASLQYLYRVPKCTISKFLPDVLDAIYSSLREYMQVPETQDEWKQIIHGFDSKWNFPSCIGAIDGKHIVIQCPPHSGSLYYNYKGQFSIVLLALVDHNYNFICIDVGSYGSHSDGGVFAKPSLMRAIETNQLNIPNGSLIVGDDTFPLKKYLMKPYPRRQQLLLKEKVYNYRHCRARRIVENAFGILSSRFRIFRKPVLLAPEKVVKVVKAACAVHNWIRKTKPTIAAPVDTEDHATGTVLPGSWRTETPSEGFMGLCATQERNYSHEARQIRDNLAQYFLGEGAVEWQYRMAHCEENTV